MISLEKLKMLFVKYEGNYLRPVKLTGRWFGTFRINSSLINLFQIAKTGFSQARLYMKNLVNPGYKDGSKIITLKPDMDDQARQSLSYPPCSHIHPPRPQIPAGG